MRHLRNWLRNHRRGIAMWVAGLLAAIMALGMLSSLIMPGLR